jgi:hypothetical protein
VPQRRPQNRALLVVVEVIRLLLCINYGP